MTSHQAEVLIAQGTVGIAIGTFFGVIATIIGFIIVYLQIHEIRRELYSPAYGTVFTRDHELKKTLLERVELYPYFFEGKDIVKEDPNYNRVYVLADMWTTHWEHVVMQKDFLPDHIWPRWADYMRSIYATSPALRQCLRESGEGFSDQLFEMFKGVQPVQEAAVPANQALQQEVVGRE
jgi:hypothetical protein